MDVSSRVADVLDFKSAGTAKVKVEYVGPAPLEGADDTTLLASLRTDGKPATLDGPPASPTLVAEAAPEQPPPQPRPAVADARARTARRSSPPPVRS